MAVKPQYVATVLTEIKHLLTDRHVIVSIAAGIPVDKLLESVGPAAHVIRVMPNSALHKSGLCVSQSWPF